MPRRNYKPIDECRPYIQEYIQSLENSTDDEDDDLRGRSSTRRYLQDLRWFDHWLDTVPGGDKEYFVSGEDEGSDDEESELWIESELDMDRDDAYVLGMDLASEFNGTTGRYRWDRVMAFYSFLERRGLVDSNPLAVWNADKKEEFGLSKSTKQSSSMEDGEKYAVEPEDVRLIEENVGEYRLRDQLAIRLIWQSGMRRDEASFVEISMIDRDAREITLPGRITKSDDGRVVAYQESLDVLLDDWLDFGKREEMVAGRDHDYLLVGQEGARLRSERISDIVVESADRAGLNRKLYADASAPLDADGNPIPNRWLITAHNLRHGYGTYLINETDAGLWEVSKQMGHSSVKITEQIYVDDDPRAGIEHVHQYGPD